MMRALAIGIGLLAATSAVQVAGQVQEPGERAAQARLPQGRAPIWATLRTTRIKADDARGIFVATHPPAVKALVGRTLTVPGFLMPLDAATRGSHFLLSKYTPVCAFCPPGEPNEVIEVQSTRPILFSARLVNVTGVFALENNGDNGLFFKMTGAAVQ